MQIEQGHNERKMFISLFGTLLAVCTHGKYSYNYLCPKEVMFLPEFVCLSVC